MDKRSRLPTEPNSFVGREHELDELRTLLRASRMVTLTGPGGIGKTRAALETARSVAADFPDGIWLFDCTPQTDEHGLAQMLTTIFEIRTATDAEDLVTRLGKLLRARCALLVFDNCERIAGRLGQMLASLLAECATLRVLVTSQRRLHCVGESLFPLPPLELPPEGEWTSDEQVANLAHVPAVQLLLTRSRAFASGFALTSANGAAVAELCRRLAGLPLALELAAARLRLLSPEQLLVRMDAWLLNLADADSGHPQHHRNLRALIEWSFALLSEREQSLLCGISIFAGACTLGGAIAIGEALGLDDAQTLDLLGGLMDKSLLNMDGNTNPPSYRLLDSVRLFAHERLVAGGSEACARRAHLMHFVKLTERFNAEVPGERSHLWHERIKREWANLHSAVDFAVTQPDLADSALALVGNLFWHFRSSTDYAQSAQWLEQALRVGQAPTRQRARALIAAGMSMYHAVELERAELRLREGIALATQVGEPWLAAAGRAILALQLAASGDFSGMETCVQAVLASAEEQQDDWLRSNALLSRGIALALHDRHREAEASISAAFECTSLHSDFFQRTYTLINRALQRFHLGDLRRAAQDWLSDLDIFTGFQHRRGVAGCVEGAAYIAAERGEFGKAARFLAAAARVRELTGAPLMPHWRKAQQVAERKARKAMGAEFQHAQQEGTSARFEKIVLEVRAMLTEIAADQPARTGASNPSGS